MKYKSWLILTRNGLALSFDLSIKVVSATAKNLPDSLHLLLTVQKSSPLVITVAYKFIHVSNLVRQTSTYGLIS